MPSWQGRRPLAAAQATQNPFKQAFQKDETVRKIRGHGLK
jgi:hypothetical protein